MALKTVGPWVYSSGGGQAINVNSGVVLLIDESDPSNIPLKACDLSNKAGVVTLGVYTSRADAIKDLNEVVNKTQGR